MSDDPPDRPQPEISSEAPGQPPPLDDESDRAAAGRNGSDSVERSLYPGDLSKPSRQQIITFSEKAEPSTPPIEEALRTTAASAPRRPLDAPELPAPEEEAPYSEDFPEEEASEEVEWISREIFLSRLLAGLVDLLLSAFAGLVFGWVASSSLGYDFFSTATIEISAAVGLVFYWVSSAFFLTLSGQTPGMHLTGLQLLYQESSELPFMAVVIRTILILPVIVLVAGLLWGFFDPWGRCLHDRLSQTRVVPIPDDPAKTRADLFG